MRSTLAGVLVLAVALFAGCREPDSAGKAPSAAAANTAASPAVRATARAFEVRAGATEVRVCPRGTALGCRTIAPSGFTVPRADAFDAPLRRAIPSDVRADGAELFLVRHEGKRGEAIYGEAYDVATGARKSRFSLVADHHVDRVLYAGSRVITIACVDDGPGCAGALVDPATGARKAIDGNFYGVDPPALGVGGDLWAFVTAGGARVDVVDLGGEPQLVSRHDLPTHGGAEDPTTVRFEPPSSGRGATIVVHFGGAAAHLAEERVDVTCR